MINILSLCLGALVANFSGFSGFGISGLKNSAINKPIEIYN